jgi:hypothetical protein
MSQRRIRKARRWAAGPALRGSARSSTSAGGDAAPTDAQEGASVLMSLFKWPQTEFKRTATPSAPSAARAFATSSVSSSAPRTSRES